MSAILVTGATGTVGSATIAALGECRGLTVRAAVRPPRSGGGAAAHQASPRAKWPSSIEPVEFDYGQPDTVARALQGIERLCLIVPSMPDEVGVAERVIAQARRSGVRHIVKLSAIGCDRFGIAFGRVHRQVEQILERQATDGAMTWTFVRPNNFMENFLGHRHAAFAPDRNGELRLPWGQGACSFVSARDIGAVAAEALAGDGHAGKIYELTGPAALTMGEAAAIIARASGRAIRYVDVPEEATGQTLAAWGLPPPMVAGVLELHALGKSGRTAEMTTTIQQVTGRSPCSFERFAQENAAVWAAQPSGKEAS